MNQSWMNTKWQTCGCHRCLVVSWRCISQLCVLDVIVQLNWAVIATQLLKTFLTRRKISSFLGRCTGAKMLTSQPRQCIFGGSRMLATAQRELWWCPGSFQWKGLQDSLMWAWAAAMHQQVLSVVSRTLPKHCWSWVHVATMMLHESHALILLRLAWVTILECNNILQEVCGSVPCT